MAHNPTLADGTFHLSQGSKLIGLCINSATKTITVNESSTIQGPMRIELNEGWQILACPPPKLLNVEERKVA